MPKLMKEPAYHNGYRRAKPTHGIMREQNAIINTLPQIGDTIVMEEIVFLNGIPQYQLSTSRLDPWARPILYTVVGFTHGADNPLDPYNKMICIHKVHNTELKQCINVLPITTGSMRTVKASPSKLKKWRYL